MAGIYRIQGFFATRKLLFLARLIWLSDAMLSGQIFKARSLHYLAYNNFEVRQSKQLGFVRDAVQLLETYNLQTGMST